MDTLRAEALGTVEETLDRVQGALGKPSYRSGNAVVYRGDCLEMMPSIDEGSIRLTITSPPYNIGKEYEQLQATEDYLAWSEAWIREVHRLTSLDGAFWLNLGYFPLPGRAKAIPIPYLLWDRIPFYLIQEVVWAYGAGVAARRSFSPRNEKFLWYVKDPLSYVFDLDSVRDPDVKYPKQRKNGKLKCNPLGKNPTDVWQFAKVTSGTNRSSKERTSHPAQFPLDVITRIVKSSSSPGDVLLDPFLGSGTVAEAALIGERAVIGIEIDSAYVATAIARLQRHERADALDRARLRLL